MLKNIILNKQYKLILINYIKNNQKKIDNFLQGKLLDYSAKNFCFYEFNENFYVTIKNRKNEDIDENKSFVNFYLGFPFPVYSINKKILTKNNREFSFYFKGEPFRCEQRKILKSVISGNFKESKWLEFNNLASFRKQFDKQIRSFCKDSLLCVDPYSFIGDSFIGMHFFDSLVDKYNFSQRIIFSKSYNHMAMLGEVYPYDLNLIKKLFLKYKCLVVPDLLDINLKKTISILSKLSNEEGVIIFPGKSIYVVNDKLGLNFFHYNQPDVILRDQNIEDYMNECMFPFISPKTAFQENKFDGSDNCIFINPFGSLENKTINLDFVVSLCQELNKEKNLKIKLICGLRDCSFHSEWMKKFIKFKKEKNIKCCLSYYSSLNQLALDLYKSRPGVILTTDTSISHLAHRLNLPTVIFYHSIRFDNSSIQSMVSESPLGFGRYFKNSYPLLIREYKKTQVKVISVFLKYLLNNKKNKSNHNFLKKELHEYFPEEYFFEFLPTTYHKKIKKILKNISPINKL